MSLPDRVECPECGWKLSLPADYRPKRLPRLTMLVSPGYPDGYRVDLAHRTEDRGGGASLYFRSGTPLGEALQDVADRLNAFVERVADTEAGS